MEEELEMKTTTKPNEIGKRKEKEGRKKRGRKEDKVTNRAKKAASDFQIITIGSPAPPESSVLAPEAEDLHAETSTCNNSNISLFSQSTVHLNVSYTC